MGTMLFAMYCSIRLAIVDRSLGFWGSASWKTIDLMEDYEFFLPRETQIDPEALKGGLAVIVRWYIKDDFLTLMATLQDAAIANNENVTFFFVDTDPRPGDLDDESFGNTSRTLLRERIARYSKLTPLLDIVLVEPTKEEGFYRDKERLKEQFGDLAGYTETTYALQYALEYKDFSWVLFTNSDNNYNKALLQETAPYRKKDIAMVYFSFVSHYPWPHIPLWGFWPDKQHANIPKDPNMIIRANPKPGTMDLGAIFFNADLWRGGIEGCNPADIDFATLAVNSEILSPGEGWAQVDGMLAETVHKCGTSRKVPVQVLFFHQ